MKERLTWEEIGEKYPDQWVGLVDVKYENNDGITIESAVVKYTDKSHDELLLLKMEERDLIHRFITDTATTEIYTQE